LEGFEHLLESQVRIVNVFHQHVTGTAHHAVGQNFLRVQGFGDLVGTAGQSRRRALSSCERVPALLDEGRQESTTAVSELGQTSSDDGTPEPVHEEVYGNFVGRGIPDLEDILGLDYLCGGCVSEGVSHRRSKLDLLLPRPLLEETPLFGHFHICRLRHVVRQER